MNRDREVDKSGCENYGDFFHLRFLPRGLRLVFFVPFPSLKYETNTGGEKFHIISMFAAPVQLVRISLLKVLESDSIARIHAGFPHELCRSPRDSGKTFRPP
jgi:hypothetical protein